MDIEQLEKKIIEEPFNPKLRLIYAERLLENGRFGEGKKQFELLISQNEKEAAIYSGAARCAFHLKQYNDAVNYYNVSKSFDNFKMIQELEDLMSGARPATGPDLKVIENDKKGADIIRFHGKQDRGGIAFDDIVGMRALKKTLRLHIVEPFLKPGIFEKFKKRAGGGILLYGPPGCGKTMIARAIATECHAYYLSVGISDVLNMWIGESERNLSDLFDKARSEKPAVLFFDELDALAYSRSKARSEHSRTVVNEFLSQLDGVDNQNDKVLILAATNMPWDVDPAMKRPGRFSRQVFVQPPDEEARTEMFKKKMEGVPASSLNFKTLARITNFFSGADIDGVIDMAKEYTLADIIESGMDREVSQEDMETAVSQVSPTTVDWLKTAGNLVKYAGADASYKEVERYLKKSKLI
ncbi:MAG: ATP-binding protein [Desulfobacterales bacterium]|nr:ATP-binding protein [Desulfobacterales bacterium]